MLDGIININKPTGFTSFDVVAKLRGILHMKKIGHTGTLDPDATGVLPVCVGKATKLCERLMDHDKIYRCTILLGIETDTEDTSGEVLHSMNADEVLRMVSPEQFLQTLMGFVGRSEQIPPMYSAIRVDGKKLYQLAREGKVIERQARPIEIYDITNVDISLPYATFTVSCSKGTYIRSLCRDIGNKLGCGGCMSQLIRLKCGDFSIEESITLEELEAIMKMEDGPDKEQSIANVFVLLEDIFKDAPKGFVNLEAQRYLDNGNVLNKNDLIIDPSGKLSKEEAFNRQNELTIGKEFFMSIQKDSPNKLRIYDQEENFRALYYYDPEKRQLKPDKMF